jgi:hypothetical protein
MIDLFKKGGKVHEHGEKGEVDANNKCLQQKQTSPLFQKTTFQIRHDLYDYLYDQQSIALISAKQNLRFSFIHHPQQCKFKGESVVYTGRQKRKCSQRQSI